MLLLGHTVSVLYCAHVCMEYSLNIPNFLEELFSLSHSVVFLYFFALITGRLSSLSLLFFGTLYSDGYIFPFLLWLCEASSDKHFALLRFFFLGMVLVTTSCTVL